MKGKCRRVKSMEEDDVDGLKNKGKRMKVREGREAWEKGKSR